MKKTLLLFCALLMLGISGVKATVTMPTLTTDPENPVLYCIQSYRSYGFVKYAGDDATPAQTLDFSDANTKFYFVAVNGTDYSEGVKIVSNVNGKKIVEMTGFDDTGTTWYLSESTYGAGCFNISKTSDASDGTCWDCSSSGGMTTTYWNKNTEGSTWRIYGVADLPQFETSTLESPKWYYIQSGRNNRYLYANGSEAGTETSNLRTDAFKFAFISTGNNGYQIVSKAGLGGNQYLSTTLGVSDSPSTWYYYNAAQSNGAFSLAIEQLPLNSYFGYNNGYKLFHVGSSGNLTTWWSTNDPGNWFTIEEVLPVCDVTYNVVLTASGTVKATTKLLENKGDALSLPAGISKGFCTYTYYSDAACTLPITTVPDADDATVYALAEYTMPFTVSANYASATWYNLRLHSSYYPLYKPDNTPNVTLPDDTNQTEANMEWAFIGNPYDGFQIINKGAGDGLVLGAPSVAGDTHTGADTHATLATAGTQTYERWFPKESTHYTNGFFLFDGEGYALNYRSKDNLAFWTSGYGSGSTFTVYSVEDNAAELTEIANNLAEHTYGAAFGQYSLSGGYHGYEGSMASSIIPALKGAYTYDNLLIARALKTATYINTPATNSFIRIKGHSTNKYAKAGSYTVANVDEKSDPDAKIPNSTGTETDGSDIWYYDEANHLINYKNGLGTVATRAFAALSKTKETTTFSESTCTAGGAVKIGVYEIKSNYSGSKIWYSNTSNVDRNSINNALQCEWDLEAVTSLPVSISAAGYATLYCPVALTIPTGVTAYTAEASLGADHLTLTAIDGGIIPANTGVILAGDEGSYNFDITTGGSASSELTGGYVTINRSKTEEVYDSYILSNGSNGIGFYHDGATTLAGFKAYLPASALASVKGFITWEFGDANAIEAVQVSGFKVQDSEIYNLAGQRISKLQKGVNIVNGKKVLVK